jgi:hypothetical protein
MIYVDIADIGQVNVWEMTIRGNRTDNGGGASLAQALVTSTFGTIIRIISQPVL